MKTYFIIPTLLFLMVSCKTYFEKSMQTRDAIVTYQYQTALNDVAGNKFLKKKRNSLLYHLELGRLFHLNRNYSESNKHFNYADDLMESYQSSLGDFAISVIANSNSKKYRAEPFEKILIHYYKALNYSYLNQTEDALVEARRMNLKEMQLGENGKKKYRNDPFGHLLMGQIYERAKDYDNAFIAYRNATEAFNDEGSKLGVEIPYQLKIDLLRSAYLSNRGGELEHYENEFGFKYKHSKSEFGEVILYWENGLAPYKVEKQYVFTLVGGAGNFYFTDQNNSMQIPFAGNINNPSDLAGLAGLRVALPDYREVPKYYISNSSITVNNQPIRNRLEASENIDILAEKTLKERFVKDLTTHLTKLALNKIAQMALQSDSTQEMQALGMIVGAAGFISEKADTRNWQSLPSMLNYTRVPLTKKGTNAIELTLINHLNQKEKIIVPVESNGNQLQIRNIFTPGKVPTGIELGKIQADTITIKT